MNLKLMYIRKLNSDLFSDIAETLKGKLPLKYVQYIQFCYRLQYKLGQLLHCLLMVPAGGLWPIWFQFFIVVFVSQLSECEQVGS